MKDAKGMQHPIINLKQSLTQVLGRQVALGEDEEAPEDPGAVGLSNIVSLLTRNISNPVKDGTRLISFFSVLVDLKIFTSV